jgi:hypothetical protein
MIGHPALCLLPEFDSYKKYSIPGKTTRNGSSPRDNLKFNGALFNQPELFELNSKTRDVGRHGTCDAGAIIC